MELDELRRRTYDNVRVMSKTAKELADKIDALNAVKPELTCEHCGMDVIKCRCYDEVSA